MRLKDIPVGHRFRLADEVSEGIDEVYTKLKTLVATAYG